MAKVSRLKVRIYEVAISYYGRTYAEGKKVSWQDGVSALRCIIKYNFFPNRLKFQCPNRSAFQRGLWLGNGARPTTADLGPTTGSDSELNSGKRSTSRARITARSS